jgi:hypothetical protein
VSDRFRSARYSACARRPKDTIFAGRNNWSRESARPLVDTFSEEAWSNYPPADPEALRLLVPQRGLFATAQKRVPHSERFRPSHL